jgi:hypothetical protein
VSTNLTWTPAASDTGAHVITFTAWDSCAAGPTQCSFTVNVGSRRRRLHADQRRALPVADAELRLEPAGDRGLADHVHGEGG